MVCSTTTSYPARQLRAVYCCVLGIVIGIAVSNVAKQIFNTMSHRSTLARYPTLQFPTAPIVTVPDFTRNSTTFAVGRTANERPHLSSLVNGTAVIGDVQFLLDFAHIGFPKTGSTTMLQWLGGHPEIVMPNNETNLMQQDGGAHMVRYLYEELPDTPFLLRGYKYPGDVRSILALNHLKKHFPSTKLIVGLRHPVLWYESFHNCEFRSNKTFASPVQIMNAKCAGKPFSFLCLLRGNMHHILVRLGKTNNDAVERYLFETDGQPWQRNNQDDVNIPNQIFLYDVAQISDKNQTRQEQFRADLQRYLHLTSPLSVPTAKNVANIKNNQTIHICEDQYAAFRSMVLVNAQRAAEWIQNYFMLSPDVHISSPAYFKEMLQSWSKDPCKQAL